MNETLDTSRFLVRRGLKKDYHELSKQEAELYYLIDAKQLASHKNIYTPRVDGGWFADTEGRSKFDSIDGGEF